MSRTLKINSYFLLIEGIGLLALPIIFIWLISDYERYVWLINGPYRWRSVSVEGDDALGLLGVTSLAISTRLSKIKEASI